MLCQYCWRSGWQGIRGLNVHQRMNERCLKRRRANITAMAKILEMVNEAIRRDFENDLRLSRLPKDVFLAAETQSKAGTEDKSEAAFAEELLFND